MNNFEKIKTLNPTEMATLFVKHFDEYQEHFACGSCINFGTHHQNNKECGDCEYKGNPTILQWLDREAV